VFLAKRVGMSNYKYLFVVKLTILWYDFLALSGGKKGAGLFDPIFGLTLFPKNN